MAPLAPFTMALALALAIASCSLTASASEPESSFYCHLSGHHHGLSRRHTFTALCAVPVDAPSSLTAAYVAFRHEGSRRHKTKGTKDSGELEVSIEAIGSVNANAIRFQRAAAAAAAANANRRRNNFCSVAVDSTPQEDTIFSADVTLCLPADPLPSGDIRFLQVTVKAFHGAEVEGIMFTYPMVDPSAGALEALDANLTTMADAIEALEANVTTISQILVEFTDCVVVANNVVTILPTCNTLVLSGAAGTGNLHIQPAADGVPTFGGTGNVVLGSTHTVSGDGNLVAGLTNTVDGSQNIVGGSLNTVTGNLNIAGGDSNTISSDATNNFVVGKANIIGTFRTSSSIVGGYNNQITFGHFNTIAGGSENVISSTRQKNTIVGGGGNTISAGYWGVIAGGSGNSVTATDVEVPQYGSVFGGAANKVQPFGTCTSATKLNDECAQGATVAGGSANTAQGRLSLVHGGYLKTVTTKDGVA